MMPTMLDLALWAQIGGPRPRQGVPPEAVAGALAGAICGAIVGLAISFIFIAAFWKLFTKAGEPGWASLVPIYSALVMARICGRSEVFGLVYMIPCIGLIILSLDLAAAYGKDTGFAIGLMLLFPIFVLILAFGDAQHVLSRRSRRRRPRDDDDDDDRPRGRRRDDDDDDDDDDEDDRPRRRPAPDVRTRRPDDRPQRRRPADDDEDDDPRPRRKRGDD